MIHDNWPTVFGERYELIAPIGEGGFAVTYRARDRRLAREVAVKVLRRAWGADPATLTRFEREAQAAAAISSPFVVPVYDFGIEAGTPYIVMELVQGGTLRDVLDRAGRLPPDAAVAIATDMLHGLAAIHAKGIVHRDVKPQNVLLDRDGGARMTDFGVALREGAVTLSHSGTALGTARYMAPEQVMGAAVGPPADLYAVGVVLFEMLAGRPPFPHGEAAPLMLAHVQQPPPLPTEVAPDLALPLPLEREVMRALAKSPADRRPSAAAMATALATAASPPSTPGRTAVTTEQIAIPPPGVRAAGAPVPPSRSVDRQPGTRLAMFGPLALIALAVAIVIAIVVSGQLWRPGPGPGDAPTTASTVAGAGSQPTILPTPFPTATMAALASTSTPSATAGLFPSGEQGAPATDSRAAGETSIAVIAPTVTPTVASQTVAPPTATMPPAKPTATATATVEMIVPVATAEQAAAAAPPGAIAFGVVDWAGGAAAPTEMGRDAVALYGAEGAGGRAALRFTLDGMPGGRMVLTINGLGDESGLAFPFGIEVNGMYIGESPATFEGWNPAQDGVNGEHAAWNQVQINLPAAVFRAGENEIALVSLMPGDYDDRPPYLLLGEAVLAPR